MLYALTASGRPAANLTHKSLSVREDYITLHFSYVLLIFPLSVYTSSNYSLAKFSYTDTSCLSNLPIKKCEKEKWPSELPLQIFSSHDDILYLLDSTWERLCAQHHGSKSSSSILYGFSMHCSNFLIHSPILILDSKFQVIYIFSLCLLLEPSLSNQWEKVGAKSNHLRNGSVVNPTERARR